MKRIIKYYFSILIIILITSNVTFAQPCKNGWNYRREIKFSNPGSILRNFQVEFLLPTATLVYNSKAQINGGDIRIVDFNGNDLNFWIDEDTYNTSSTSFWVKMDSLAPAGNTSVFVFYGKTGELSQSNGSATFEMFDDFNSSILSSKWSRCDSNNNNISFSNGNLILSSSFGNNASIISDSIFSDSEPVTVEMDLETISQGKLFLGIESSSTSSGLGMSYNAYGGTSLMELETSSSTNSALCRSTTSLANFSALNVTGTWSYSKYASNFSYLSWPGGIQQNHNESQSQLGNHRILLSSLNQSSNSSASIDWVRVRKYSSANITVTLESEIEVFDNIDISNTGPYCQGDSIIIEATYNNLAEYIWFKGADTLISFSDTNRVVIPNSTVDTAGLYSLTVQITGGCNPQTISTNVEVNSFSNGGLLKTQSSTLQISGLDSSVHISNLCPLINSDSIYLESNNGNVIYWESSLNIGGPWNNIYNTNSYYKFSSMVNSMYFRAIIQNQICPMDTSNFFKANIYPIVDAGYLIGGNNVCEGTNSGSLELTGHVGSILKWQKSTDNSLTWVDISNTTNKLDYTNLTDTTVYRAIVNSGSCINDTSNTQTISIYPKPISGFSYLQVCQGSPTIFNDTSTISSGQISSYSWNFGSGLGSNVKNPLIILPFSGNHNVLLVATSNHGCTDSVRNNSVIVNSNPVANFTQSDVCDGDNMVYSNSSIGTSLTYTYDFGDGTGYYNSSNGDTVYTFPTHSNYDVKLRVQSINGCTDSITKNVNVYPRANIAFIGDSVCLGQSINFINTTQTTASSISYIWNFGDGSNSGLNSPSHTYLVPDTFSVSLISNTNTGCSDSFIDTVIVYPVPDPLFTVDSICLYDSSSFINTTDTILTPNLIFNWNFGDGYFSNDYSPSHLYSSNNNYNITLSVSSADGCNSSITKILSVSPIPNANFSFNDVCFNESAIFQNSSTPGGLSFSWDFGDANTSIFNDPSHNYLSEGSYNVQLISSSNSGCLDTLVKIININPLPNPNFNFTNACYGSTTQFANNSLISSLDSISSYLWDFGDGQNSIVKNPSHLYLNDGLFNVGLSATSSNGCLNDTVIGVVVNPFPAVNFTFIEACINQDLIFTNQSTISDGTPLTFNWDFGDGQNSILENPINIYNSSGIKTVKLICSSSFGCKDSIEKTVEVFPLPTVFAGKDTSVSKGYSVQLLAFISGGINFNWSPLEGLNNNTIFNPEASPTLTTDYILEVTDFNGCINSDTLNIEVINDFKLFVNNVVTPNGNGENDTWYVENIESLSTARVYIYNRRGTEIYYDDNYKNDWNGYLNDDELPDGTYYYIINFTDSDKVYRGAITLLRNK